MLKEVLKLVSSAAFRRLKRRFSLGGNEVFFLGQNTLAKGRAG
jgi:hypothetical protein